MSAYLRIIKRGLGLFVIVLISRMPCQGDTRVLLEPIFRGVVFPDVSPRDALGAAISGIGDFNGDGIDDIAMSAAPLLPIIGGLSTVYIVFGRSNFPSSFDLTSLPGVIKIESIGSSHFGADLFPAGDLDGDKLADIYIHQADARDRRLYLL